MLKRVNFKGIELVVSDCGSKIYHENILLHQSKFSPNNNNKFFKQVSLYGSSYYVHHIVAAAYVKNPRPGIYKMVLHKNCDTIFNHYLNLEYGNYEMNMENRAKMGINSRSTSSITEKQAVKIAARLDAGEFASTIALEYSVSDMSIRRIRRRYCKLKTVCVKYSKDVKETVLKLAEKHGASSAANTAGIKYHTVYRWLKKAQEIDIATT